MSELETIKLPDIGDFDEVEIIEVLVSNGDTIAEETSLITVESDKASMEIPSPVAGTITSLLVAVGDKLSAGSDLLVVDVAAAAKSNERNANATSADSGNAKGVTTSSGTANTDSSRTAPASSSTASTSANEHYDVVVIGAGPGGYTAAFRAADLGQKVLLIERYASLGGVCLNVGCIPSKALLHTAAIIQETRKMSAHGVTFSEPEIDIDKLRGFKQDVIGKLTGGLAGLAKQRNITVVQGVAAFASPTTVAIDESSNESSTGSATQGANKTDIDLGDAKFSATGDTQKPQRVVGFSHAIIAAGSQNVRIPGFPYEDLRLMDSTGALELADIPNRLLIIGGGIIGLEMGCVYAGLGSQVSVVELSDGLMPGCDRDLVKPLERRLKKDFENIYIGSKVTAIQVTDAGLEVSFDGGKAPANDTYDRILLAVGRKPNGKLINAEAAGVTVDEHGFIKVDSQQRTNIPNIFAIGDIVGQPMLAHKATHEAKVAAEVAAGHKAFFDAKTIPSVAYTDPEIAWMGLTEIAAKENGTPYEKASFPWAASGRSLSMDRSDGMTKVLFDPETRQLLGAGMVGPNAGELIAEAVLALEMGADMEDLALTIHPHPTLSETLNFAAEVAEGTVTDIYIPRKGK
ncbi:MAG: dihydrolipoyl dehydrogenase [Granulosicoccus sp.]